MGYTELLQALEEEIGRQVRELQAEARQERERLLEVTRRELDAGRKEVLERERRRLDEEASRALSLARLERERVILTEMRRLMAELLREAEVRLPTLNDATLLARLVEELIPECGEGSVEFRVEKGHEEDLGRYLREQHPEILSRANLVGSREIRGGVEVSLGGRQVLDNTLSSRLVKVWQLREGEMAAKLFGEGNAGL